MTDAMSIASAGLRAGTAQFQKAAENVVKAGAPQVGDTANAEQAGQTGDVTEELPQAIVDTKISAFAVKANAIVFKTAAKTLGTLLDIKT